MGQAAATLALGKALEGKELKVDWRDTGGSGRPGLLARLPQHFRALVDILRGRKVAYLSLNAGQGMWLTCALVGVARLRGIPTFVHHHSYAHITAYKPAMAMIARLGGQDVVHIVLGPRMEAQLAARYPGLNIFVLNNAGLVDPGLLDLEPNDGPGLVLGHLSNLSADKGITEVVDTAIGCREAGLDVQLKLAGPITDAVASAAVEKATETLGDRFTYLGPVGGEQKRDFFQSIDVFLFPTNYVNEAAPMVLYEAMAANVPCLSNERGCISDMLGHDGGKALALNTDFTTDAAQVLRRLVNADWNTNPRKQYLASLEEHHEQIVRLASTMAQHAAS